LEGNENTRGLDKEECLWSNKRVWWMDGGWGVEVRKEKGGFSPFWVKKPTGKHGGQLDLLGGGSLLGEAAEKTIIRALSGTNM